MYIYELANLLAETPPIQSVQIMWLPTSRGVEKARIVVVVRRQLVKLFGCGATFR